MGKTQGLLKGNFWFYSILFSFGDKFCDLILDRAILGEKVKGYYDATTKLDYFSGHDVVDEYKMLLFYFAGHGITFFQFVLSPSF